MGEIINFSCKKCGLDENAFIGVGMFAEDKNIFGDDSSIDEMKRFKLETPIIRNNELNQSKYFAKTKVPYCNHCKRFGKDTLNKNEKCRTCNEPIFTFYDLEDKHDEEGLQVCPNCGVNKMKVQSVGMWD